ncbi:MAG: hypothetical protein AAFX52_15055 [Pseudomonadota bacterium]
MVDQATYPKLRVPFVTTVADHAQASIESLRAIDRATSADTIVAALTNAQAYDDLAKMFLFMLPKREAVWLICLWARGQEGAREIAGMEILPSKALGLAEDWVRTQDDALRYKAQAAADAEEMNGPGAWAGMAAFWSGTSLAPPDRDPVAPDDAMTGIAGVCALALAGAEGDMGRPFLGYDACAELGRDLGQGGSGADVLKAALSRYAEEYERSKS